jgi:hypothetical protein
MTLLEVLVACGILVVGLASVAAILPAASSLLAEAANIDRAAALAANAAADVKARGVLRASLFAGGIKTLVSGDLFASSKFNTAPFKKQAGLGTPADEAIYARLDYAFAVTPFPSPGPVQSGTPAQLTVAVFRKSDAEASGQQFQLAAVGGGVYKLTGPSAQADRKRFFPGCSWVLAKAGDSIHWLHVAGSWQTGADAFIAFTDAAAATAAASGGTLNVDRFNPVLCINETIITLE